jgi:hypothetical protein
MRENVSRSNLLRLIKLANLRYYLKDTGWVEEATQKSIMMKFRSPRPIGADSGAFINLFIPKDDTLVDYMQTIEYALKTLSTFEKRASIEIIYQILNFADCLKTKILEAKAGMIPLTQGILLYRGTLDLITFSACGEFEPSVKKFPRKIEKASKYAETSLLGQSDLGSYVANIYLPLGRHPPDYPWATADPFPRKVVLRILRGIGDLVDSVSEKSPDPIIKNYKRGLNSNMCGAVIDIINSGMGNKVIMSAILEPAFDSPDDISTNFVLNPSDKNYLNDAIDIFEKDAPQEEERPFIGYVKLLSRPEEREKGVIILTSPNPLINKSINIKMELSPSDYHKAVDAHDLKLYVKVTGILEKVGYRWFLRDAHDLEIFDKDSEEPWKALTRS